MTTDHYLYGLVLADHEIPADSEGVQGGPIRTIGSGRIAAVVGDLDPEQPLGSPEDLLAHTTVLDEIVTTAPVLPVAFGTIIPGDSPIDADLLEPREEEFYRALQTVRGRTQYTLRVRFDHDVALREILSENQEAAELRDAIAGTTEDETRPQRIRLGEIIVRSLEHRRPAYQQSFLEQLEEVGDQVSEREVSSAEDIVEAAVLVRHDDADAFEEAVEVMAREHHDRMRFRLVGPQAPYDFVPEL